MDQFMMLLFVGMKDVKHINRKHKREGITPRVCELLLNDMFRQMVLSYPSYFIIAYPAKRQMLQGHTSLFPPNLS